MEDAKIGGIPCEESHTEKVLSVDLGSTLEIEIQAEGIPTLVYEWLKLPPGKKIISFSSIL